jgi:hypothetical protein
MMRDRRRFFVKWRDGVFDVIAAPVDAGDGFRHLLLAL